MTDIAGTPIDSADKPFRAAVTRPYLKAAWWAQMILLGLAGALVIPTTLVQSHLFLLPGLALAGVVIWLGRSGRLAQPAQPGWVFALILLTVALGLRLAAMGLRFEPSDDFLVYHQAGIAMSQQWSLGAEGYRCFYPPGQVFALGLVYRLLGPNIQAAQLLNIAYAAGTVLGIWYLGRQLFSDPVGRTGALLYAVAPSQVLGCLLTGAEVPGAFWLVTGLCAYAGTVARGRRPVMGMALTGVLLGVGALVRPQLLLLTGPLALHTLMIRKRPWPRRLALAGLLGVAALLTILPWTIRNYRVTGGFILISSNGGGNLWSANNDAAQGQYTEWVWVHLFTHAENDLQLQRMGMEHGLAWIRNNPGRFALLACKKFALFWATDHEIAWWATVHCGYGEDNPIGCWMIGLSNGHYLATMLAAVAAVFLLRRRLITDGRWSVLPGLLICYTAVHMVFESQGKYRFVLTPLLCLLAAMVIAVGRSRASEQDSSS